MIDKNSISFFVLKNGNIKSNVLNETISHLRKDYSKISEEQFNKILKLDPTYKGGDKETPYTRWIFKLIYNNIKNAENLQRYNELMKKYPSGINTETNQPINKPIMLPEVLPEDVYKIPDLIAEYEENKKLIKLPISSFTSLPALSKAVSDAIQKDISIDEKAGKNFRVFKEAIPDGLNVVYQDDSWIIGISTTYKASEHFKEITSWCTGKPNMYAQYTEKLGGNPLYIHLNKKTGDLYQMDFGTPNFMDSFDNTIDIPLFLKENPQLKKFYESILLQNNKFLSMPENWQFIDKKYITEEIQLAAVKQNGNAIQYIIYAEIIPSEQVQLAAVKQKSSGIQYIIEGGITPSEEVQLVVVKQDGYAIKYIIELGIKPSEQVQLEAVKQNTSSFDYIKKPYPSVIKLYKELIMKNTNETVTPMFLSKIKEGNLFTCDLNKGKSLNPIFKVISITPTFNKNLEKDYIFTIKREDNIGPMQRIIGYEFKNNYTPVENVLKESYNDSDDIFLYNPSSYEYKKNFTYNIYGIKALISKDFQTVVFSDSTYLMHEDILRELGIYTPIGLFYKINIEPDNSFGLSEYYWDKTGTLTKEKEKKLLDAVYKRVLSKYIPTNKQYSIFG